VIALRHLNGKPFFVNAEMIKFIEETPDTIITLRDGDKIMVADPAQEVVAKAIAYARMVRILPALEEGAGGSGGAP
jgi:flagellar protein FlbD